MPRHTESRAKAVRTAGRLFQEQGYAATGLTEIIEQSGSPKGSFYFHFPGGKEQLAVEALRSAGEQLSGFLRELAARSTSPARLVRGYAAEQERLLVDSDFRRGSPVATVALEMSADSEPIRDAVNEVFGSWTDIITGFLKKHGHSTADARRLAEYMIAAFEGALVLARAQRSATPLRNAAKTVAAMLTPRSDGS